MKILFVSDYVCPYCLVAKEALETALSRLGLTPEITVHPFELTVEPAPRVDTWNDENRRSHYQVLTEPCKSLGLDMKLPPHVVPRPYSRMAFEGYFFAKEQGCDKQYNDLVYRAYFIHEEDIGDREVLCRIAEECGMDPAAFGDALENRTYRKELEEANRHAREVLQVTHVPTIYVDDKKIDLEAYTAEEFIRILS